MKVKVTHRTKASERKLRKFEEEMGQANFARQKHWLKAMKRLSLAEAKIMYLKNKGSKNV